jgi:signal transduction histidine kinase
MALSASTSIERAAPDTSVSCLVLAPLLRYADHLGGDVARMVEGLPWPEAHLRDGRARIDWAALRLVCRRFRDLYPGDPDALRRAGSMAVRLGAFGRRAVLAALLARSPATLYRRAPRVLEELVRGARVEHEPMGDHGCRLRCRLPSGHDGFVELEPLAAGVLVALPTLVGARQAEVTSARAHDGLVCEVRWQPGPGIVRRLVRLALQRADEDRRVVRDLVLGHAFLERELSEARLAASRAESRAAVVGAAFGGTDPAEVVRAVSEQLDSRAGVRIVYARLAGGAEVGDERYGELVPERVLRSFEAPGAEPLEVFDVPRLGSGYEREQLWAYRAGVGGPPAALLVLAAHGGGLESVDRALVLDALHGVAHALDGAARYDSLRQVHRSVEREAAERARALEELGARLRAREDEARRDALARRRGVARAVRELDTRLTLFVSSFDTLWSRLERAGNHGPKWEASVQRSIALGRRGALRVAASVEELVALVRAEPRNRAAPQAVDLGATCARVAEELAVLADVRNVRVEVQASPTPHVLGDRTQLEGLVFHLAARAVRESATGSSVLVQVLPQFDRALVRVLDRSPGPVVGTGEAGAAGGCERAGGPDPAVAEGGTAEIDLVRDIVELHQGELLVEDRVGGGTIVTFRMPFVPGPALAGVGEPVAKASAADRIEAAPEQESAATGRASVPEDRLDASTPPLAEGSELLVHWPDTRRRLVLVVDGDADGLRSMRTSLEDEFDVMTAGSTAAALEAMARRSPDAVVVDAQVPGISGSQLGEMMRGNPDTRAIPVVLLTARDAGMEAGAGGERGADDFVAKPFRGEELAARVRTHIRLRELVAENVSMASSTLLGTMAAGIAHEMRNPLNVLVNSIAPLEAGFARADPGSDKVRLLLRLMRDSAARLANVADMFEKLTSRSADASLVDLRELLTDLVETRRFRMKDQVLVVVRCEIDRPLAVQRSQITVAVGNLLDNGIDAVLETGRQGSIEIEARVSDGGVRIAVHDTGGGMSRARLEKAVEPFFTTKKPGRGTGLGLTIVRHLAVALGGRLELRSELDRGTTATLWIPLEPARAC